MMHFSQQEIRNNCFSKKNAFTIPVKPSFLLLSVTGPAKRARGREGGGGNASFRPCRQGGFNPCPSTKANGLNLVPRLARLDIIEYVLEMVTNSSIRRVQAFPIGLQEGRTRHRRSMGGIWLGRGPLHTYCNMEDIFIVRTRVLFF